MSRTVPIVFLGYRRPGWRWVRRQSSHAQAATQPASHPFEYGMSGKWLELLKQIASGYDAGGGSARSLHNREGVGQFAAIQSVAPLLGVELRPVDVRDAGEIERAVAAFASRLNGGLIVTASPMAGVHRNLIVTLAARPMPPAVLGRADEVIE